MENNLIKKWAKDLNRYFSQKDMQKTNKHINVMQIKTTSHPLRWLELQTLKINAGKHVEKRDSSCTAVGV